MSLTYDYNYTNAIREVLKNRTNHKENSNIGYKHLLDGNYKSKIWNDLEYAYPLNNSIMTVVKLDPYVFSDYNKTMNGGLIKVRYLKKNKMNNMKLNYKNFDDADLEHYLTGNGIFDVLGKTAKSLFKSVKKTIENDRTIRTFLKVGLGMGIGAVLVSFGVPPIMVPFILAFIENFIRDWLEDQENAKYAEQFGVTQDNLKKVMKVAKADVIKEVELKGKGMAIGKYKGGKKGNNKTLIKRGSGKRRCDLIGELMRQGHSMKSANEYLKNNS